MQKKGYISLEELSYIKKRFSEDLVKRLRKCFFSEVKEEDRKELGDPETIRILKKLFVPEYDPVKGEIFDNPDTVQRVEPMGFDFETLSVVMKAQLKAKELITNTLDDLAGKSHGTGNAGSLLNLKLSNDDKENAQNIFNRATTIRIIESGIQGLYTISHTEIETEEEKKAKRAKDSLK
jgi:hypothetical protein